MSLNVTLHLILSSWSPIDIVYMSWLHSKSHDMCGKAQRFQPYTWDDCGGGLGHYTARPEIFQFGIVDQKEDMKHCWPHSWLSTGGPLNNWKKPEPCFAIHSGFVRCATILVKGSARRYSNVHLMVEGSVCLGAGPNSLEIGQERTPIRFPVDR
ncbi:hypothetical protein SDJN02_10798, partial [Cucurbita argyrosperma subsp. argyrosperma]